MVQYNQYKNNLLEANTNTKNIKTNTKKHKYKIDSAHRYVINMVVVCQRCDEPAKECFTYYPRISISSSNITISSSYLYIICLYIIVILLYHPHLSFFIMIIMCTCYKDRTCRCPYCLSPSPPRSAPPRSP